MILPVTCAQVTSGQAGCKTRPTTLLSSSRMISRLCFHTRAVGEDADSRLGTIPRGAGLRHLPGGVLFPTPRSDLTGAFPVRGGGGSAHLDRPDTPSWGAREEVRYVQVFENKGEMMGCSNPHPHSQIWSTSYLPNEPAKEQTAWKPTAAARRLPAVRYSSGGAGAGERVVVANDHFVVLTPYWAIWPFETLVISRRHLGSLTDLTLRRLPAWQIS